MPERISQSSASNGFTNSAVRTSLSRGSGSKFAGELERATGNKESLRISSHARKRLDACPVSLNESDLVRIDQAVEKAAQKGSGQSVVVLDDLALVVSIRNRVVITAVHGDRMKQGVFTNIDSVVIA